MSDVWFEAYLIYTVGDGWEVIGTWNVPSHQGNEVVKRVGID